MQRKLFITDFDGTLLKDDKTVGSEDFETLDRLQQNNVCTAIATGRSLYSFLKAVNALKLPDGRKQLPIDYLMFSTGAGIFDCKKKEVIFTKVISSEKIREVTDYFDVRQYDYMVLDSTPGSAAFFYKLQNRKNSDFHTRLALYQDYATPLPENHAYVDPAIEILAIMADLLDAETLIEVRSALSDFSVIHTTSPLDNSSSWIEVFDKNVSKGRTAEYLASLLEIDQKNTISVGNDYNDQDLLSWSKKAFVVENGPQRLKNEFTSVASNNHSGVSRAVELSGVLEELEGLKKH